jgi:hypothetical protein
MSSLLLLLALASPAFAVDAQSSLQEGSQKEIADYLHDLASDSDPDRLFAARVLKGDLARALATERRAPEGSLPWLDARSLLVELDARLPDACRVAIRHQNATAPCADIYAMLQYRPALPLLVELRAGEQRKPVQRRLDAAIATLTALPEAPP